MNDLEFLRWLRLPAAALFMALLLLSCAQPGRQAAPAIVKPPLDTREYRYLELPNRMRVVLISDPATDKSAASLRVNVGSGDNPPQREGLAHFLEHMLFLGTDRYPDPGEYMEFISAHGGSNNAYTSIDHTNYFFDIQPESLEQALDRFSRFFVAPLFNPEYVEREMNAVESEYRMGLKDDARREYDVLRELVNQQHPLAKFSVGSLQTLKDGDGKVLDDLMAFYRRHYSANLMSLVVLGREPLDSLQAMVSERFAPVPDRDASERTSAPPLFAAGSLPMEVRIRPDKEQRELTLLFPVPSARERYEAKPLEYIGTLLGHEGKGSLLSVLKARGWAEGLGAGAGLDLYGQDAMQITVQLGAEGARHQREIVSLVFAAIAQLREQGIAGWRFEEQARLGDIAFRFREKGSPTGTVIRLANALQDYPVEDIVRGPYVYRDFDPGLLRSYLDQLRPDNVLITYSGPDVESDRRSAWYDAPYAVRHLDASELVPGGADQAILGLPQANEFIPQQFALKALPAEPAQPLLEEDPGYRLWFVPDTGFGVPKASVYFQVLSPASVESPRAAALTELLARMVSDQLNEFAYPATLAGQQYDIAATGRGLAVKIGGYDDRQDRLLQRILHAIVSTDFDPERFEGVKTELLRVWRNAAREKPFVQLAAEMATTMMAQRWSDRVLADALQPLDLQTLRDFSGALRRSAAFEVLVHGNYSREEALAAGQRIREALTQPGSAPAAAPGIDVVRLETGDTVALDMEVEHPDSALLMLVQGADSSRAERVRMALSAQILSAPFFDELRTERQLGYAVFAQSRPLHRVPGLLMLVQSPTTAPAGVAAAIEAFLHEFGDKADAMSAEDFARYRDSLVQLLREAPKTLAERTERIWSDISIGAFSLDDREQLAREAEQLTLEQWQAYYHQRIEAAGRPAILLYSQGSAVATDSRVPGRVVTAAELERSAKYYRFAWEQSGEEP